MEGLKQLADYCIDYHFTTLKSKETKYSLFLESVVQKTAEMIANWQAVGFCHGVMNTDNFSILGLTIDYGPFQFMDTYDPYYICNHSDETGRYAFINQPNIGLWNLVRFVTALAPLIKTEAGDGYIKVMQDILAKYSPALQLKYANLMCKKFGFDQGSKELMETVVQPCLKLLADAQMDYTKFFRVLSTQECTAGQMPTEYLNQWQSLSNLAPSEFEAVQEESETGQSLSTRFAIWYIAYKRAFATQNITPGEVRSKMKSVNPKYILRNNLAQMVIEKVEEGDTKWVDRYLTLLQNPFDEGTEDDERVFAGLVPKKLQGIKCSCSS